MSRAITSGPVSDYATQHGPDHFRRLGLHKLDCYKAVTFKEVGAPTTDVQEVLRAEDAQLSTLEAKNIWTNLLINAMTKQNTLKLDLQCDAWLQEDGKLQTRPVATLPKTGVRGSRYQLWYTPGYARAVLMAQFKMAGANWLIRSFVETSVDPAV